MKKLRITFILMLVLCVPDALSARKDSLVLVFWNLENFFDWRDDSLSTSTSDTDFSSFGSRHWTKRKFQSKCLAIAKSFLWIGDRMGGMPDIIGLAEVENSFVLRRLLDQTALRRMDFSIVHFESPDPRGIDAALLYRRGRLRLLEAKPLSINKPSSPYPPILTRDILLAQFLTKGGDSLAVLVNHHPSKYGDDSQWKREAALHALRQAADSLQDRGFKKVVAMGDFNDTPDNPVFDILTAAPPEETTLESLALPLAERGEGTIRYLGKWEMIDHFFISKSLERECRRPRMEVLRVPFLMTRDNTYSGDKPLRTFIGPRYSGGVSDHCPIVFEIE